MTRAGISASIGRDQQTYSVIRERDGLRMNNVAQKLQALFGNRGVEFTAAKNKWNLEFEGFGTADGMIGGTSVVPTANANRIEYRRAGITEWYVNGPFGVEQGFTIDSAPAGNSEEILTINLSLSGDLSASLDDDAHGITLKRDSAAVLHYGDLSAVDARGRELPSWMEVQGDSLRLHANT